MTPEEYERRPEVKEALKLVRKHRRSLITSGWASFKNRLMDLMGIPRDQYMKWDVPTEYIYAFKRVGRQPGERAWSKEDAFRQVVTPAIKAGRLSLEGVDPEPESEPDPDVVEMELGDVTIQAQRVGVGVEGADPHEMTYAYWIKVDYDELEFAFITSNKAITDRQLIIVALGWLFDALKMGLEDFTRHFLGPNPYPEIEKPLTEKAKEIFRFAEKWEMPLLDAAKRLGPEVRDQLADEDPDGR